MKSQQKNETSPRSQLVPAKIWQVSHSLNDVEQTAVFDAERSELVLLNGTGGLIWELIDGTRSVAAIAHELEGLIVEGPGAEVLLGVTLGFLDEMAARGALEFKSHAP